MVRRELRITMGGKAHTLERSRQTKFGKRFDSKENRINKADIRDEALRVLEEMGVTVPIPPGPRGYTMTVFVRKKPAMSTTKKKLKLIEDGKLLPKVTPDLDNVLKLWEDALVQGGIIEDDRNITSVSAFRRYSDREEVECLLYWDEGEEDDGQ